MANNKANIKVLENKRISIWKWLLVTSSLLLWILALFFLHSALQGHRYASLQTDLWKTLEDKPVIFQIDPHYARLVSNKNDWDYLQDIIKFFAAADYQRLQERLSRPFSEPSLTEQARQTKDLLDKLILQRKEFERLRSVMGAPASEVNNTQENNRLINEESLKITGLENVLAEQIQSNIKSLIKSTCLPSQTGTSYFSYRLFRDIALRIGLVLPELRVRILPKTPEWYILASSLLATI